MRINIRSASALLQVFIIFVCTTCHQPLLGLDIGMTAAGHEDTHLTENLQKLITGFPGTAGIYVRHLASGRTAEIRADELFPTASMIKIPILLSLFERIESGTITYDEEFVYRDSLYYPGEDILGSFKDGEKILLSKLVMLMITMSDNTASLWCQHLAGTGLQINQWLSEHGFEKTRMNSRTPDRRKDWETYGWGQTTPREMAELLVMIREGKAVSAAASEEMYRVLCNIYWNGEALSQIPPYIQAASKQGAVDESRSEVVLVNAPSGDYVFCVITKNQKDTSWEYENEGYVLIRAVSRYLWHYFEPASDWQPAPGFEKWAK